MDKNLQLLSFLYISMNFNHTLWGEIVPDGPRFCHWGGRKISRTLVKMMRIKSYDRILDLCCGEGGTTDYISKAQLVVGIDISKKAIKRACKNAKSSNTLFLTADARSLPFADKSFDKIICQDADVWMYGDKGSLMNEVNRVLTPNGLFVWQSYASNETDTKIKTKRLLGNVGYIFNELPCLSEVKNMFRGYGFSIINYSSLYKIYREGNMRMLARAKSIKSSKIYLQNQEAIDNLIVLLEWERELFRKKLWTGVLVIAKKLA